jgi:hypothetical protein
MAQAVGQSPALKILLPVNRCNTVVVGVSKITPTQMVKEAVDMLTEHFLNFHSKEEN